jgi:hypothetical protein
VEREVRDSLMFTLRCTRKLLQRLATKPSSEVVEPSTVLGDWYANLLLTRPQRLVLAMNERTLLVALVPARGVREFGHRLRDAVGELLLAIGLPAARVAQETAAMKELRIGATASRSVLGCMNDATLQLRAYPRDRRGEWPPLLELELHLAENIYSVTGYQTPWLRTLELFGVRGAVRVRRVPAGHLH